MNNVAERGMRPVLAELFDLTGKTAIVTAAGQGLGRGIAQRLAQAGANLVVSARRVDTAETVAAGIRESGGQAIAARTEVTDIDQIDETVQAAIDAFGAIDILVNNAGGMHTPTPFLEVTPQMWQETTDRNMKGAYFLTQRVARTMVAAGRPGRIVNIASTAGVRPDQHLAAYSVSKSGVIALTNSLCAELARLGITINTVSPGPTLTTNTEVAYGLPFVQEMMKGRVPLGGAPGEPQDVANAVLYCASPAARHMTGAHIVIDGGFSWT